MGGKRLRPHRRRHAGPREANGKPLRRDRALAELRANQRAARDVRRHVLAYGVPEDRMMDPLCADCLGVLKLIGQLDERQYQSGVAYRDAAQDYRVLQGLPSGLPKILGVKGVSHYEADPARVARVTARYELLCRRIGARGAKVLSVVHAVCANDRMVETREQLTMLKAGLSVIGGGPQSGNDAVGLVPMMELAHDGGVHWVMALPLAG